MGKKEAAERTGKAVLDAVRGWAHERPPLWLLRQAGRYLPEYRQVRAKARDFLGLCYAPELASEVTLQPLRRFDLDAAIVFSDILVIPDALGQTVRFEEGEGPVLEAITDAVAVGRLRAEGAVERLAPVMETVQRVRAELASDKTMIGFCGAPWTVASYMIGGRGSVDQAAARRFALTHQEAFEALLDMLVEVSAGYLAGQLRSGADVVQIFESWGGGLDEVAFRRWVIAPTEALVRKLRSRVRGAAVIGYVRGGSELLVEFAQATGVNAVGIDHTVPVGFARRRLSGVAAVQGNLDPLRLVAGGEQMRARAEEIVEAFTGTAHVFNLGHGIRPETPVGNVEELIAAVRGGE